VSAWHVDGSFSKKNDVLSHNPNPLHDARRELFFDVILVDGRAQLSCALKALGYATNATSVFINDWPRKYGKRLLRYYHLVRTIGWDGAECEEQQPGQCLAQLRPKPQYLGDHQVLYL